MKPLLSAEQMRACDRYSIDKRGVPELVLMEHAALAVVARLQARFGSLLPQISGLILVGPGNNGADALAVARLLHNLGNHRLTLFAPDTEAKQAAFQTQLKIVKALEIPISQRLSHVEQQGFVVDGFFGTGLLRPLTDEYARAVDAVNHVQGPWKIAIDIPSGLHSDTGRVLGKAVKAHETVTLGFLKRGLVTGEAPEYTGVITLAPIQIPPAPKTVSPAHYLLEREDARQFFPRRSAISHKGVFGHLFVWIGRDETTGASGLAALAGLRCGVGLSTAVGTKEACAHLQARLPLEVMTHVAEASFWQMCKGVLVLGPGLGTDATALETLTSALHSSWPLVLDADALNLIADHPELVKFMKSRKCPTVLTPHPKEASRLLGCTTAVIEENRFEALESLTKKFPATIVLKGKGTLIGEKDHTPLVVTAGTPNLAKGGSGDLLAGIVGSCLTLTASQGLSTLHAAALGVYLHGTASEVVSQQRGEDASTLASEIAAALPTVISLLHGN